MPFAVILFSTIFGAVCVFTLLFRCLGAVSARGGSLAMILGTDVRLESPNPTPFIYQAKWKTWPIHILPRSKIDPIYILFLKIDPIHILFFKIYPFIYFLGEKDTPLIYFWCKNDTHSYTGRPEKYTPFQPHICIYLYNGSYPPPPPVRFGISIDRQTTVVTKSGNHCPSLGKADNLNRSVISLIAHGFLSNFEVFIIPVRVEVCSRRWIL